MPKSISMLGERLTLLQPEEGLRTTSDAVLLAAACPVRAGESLLDLGCGVGSAGLCVLARVDGVALTGLDIQADHIDLARDNAFENGFAGSANFLVHDVREDLDRRFDHVICNPPYLEAGTHIPSPSFSKAMAKGEAVLEDWVSSAHRCVKSRGSFTLIHRADQIDRIIRELGRKFGGIEIIPLWPRVGEDAKRVIVRSVKDSKSPAIVRSGLVLHEGGNHTKGAEAIFRRGKGLSV